jgi:hypothetical protein
MVLVVLLRSFFDVLVWMVPLVLFLLYLTWRSESRWPLRRAAICGVYLLAAMAPYLKNLLLVGSFATSTWFGMNLVAMTTYVAPEEIDRLVKEERISPLMQVRRFSPAEVYLAHFAEEGQVPQTGVMALDAPVKTTGKPNFNNLVYVWAAREYLQSSLYLIRNYPLDYLKAVLTEVSITFSQSSRVFTKDSPWREALERAWRNPFSKEFFWILFLPSLLFLGYCSLTLLQAWEAWRLSRRPGSPAEVLARMAVLGMSAFNLAYVLAVSSLFELGEGCYMRGPVDPLIAAGTMTALARLFRKKDPDPAPFTQEPGG